MDEADDDRPRQRPPLPPGTFRFGSIAGVDVLVRSSWLLVAALIAVLLAPQIEELQPGLGPLAYVGGLAMAVLLYLSVLLHEASHAIAAQRLGLKVRSISLHFLGGATEIEGESQTARQEFVIAVVGPLTSIAVGAVAWLARDLPPPGVLALAVELLAVTNLFVGALNLVPGLPLDGGRVLRAVVWRVGGDMHRGTIVAAWGGRVSAVLALLWPAAQGAVTGTEPRLSDYVVYTVVAVFLWSGATAFLVNARLRSRLPGLVARPLARRVVAVPENLPVAEAVRRAQEAGAGGIVMHAPDDRLTGIVNEAALLATPVERRAFMPVSAVARTIEDGMVLDPDLAGEDLVRAMSTTPAAEYVLVDPDGTLYGLLVTADVDRAFAEQSHR